MYCWETAGTNLRDPILVDEYVEALEVPVNDHRVLAVQVLHAGRYVQHHLPLLLERQVNAAKNKAEARGVFARGWFDGKRETVGWGGGVRRRETRL